MVVMVGEGNPVSQCIDTGNYEKTSNRASWNEFHKAFLVELLVEFHLPGARKQNGWSSGAWNEITTRFNAKFSNTNFSEKQIKEQEHTLRKQYKTIQRLRHQPGFGWDISTNMVTAPEQVRDPLLKDKEIKRWYNKPFPYYDALHKVYYGFIATGKRKRGSNNFTNNEVEFEPPSSTIHAPREQPHFDVEDEFLNTQEENSPISTQPNLNFAQEPSPIHQSMSTSSIIASMREEMKLIGASIEKKSDRAATQGWSKAKIDQHKAKQKRPLEELEQDADQNHPQSRQVRVISSMENGQKCPWEELEQDANKNQPQSKLVRVVSSMENGQKRQWEQREQDANQNHPQFSQLHIEELPTLKLVFANEVTQPIYTGKNITDNNKMPIEIQLIDINTGRQCTKVEGFNIKVKIVVIDGDLELEGLDSDKFKSKIVINREGKRPLLIGNTEVTFNQQGVGTIGDIYFTDNSKWLRSGKFRLGACIDSKRCGTNIMILEGLSEKFAVMDRRGLSYKKHYPPKLNDNVWRLVGIAKDGKYHQRLKDNKINSVQDFLKSWKENPSVLEKILKMQTSDWNKVAKHAQTCCMELDNANLENNADLPKSPGPEPFTLPNPMPEGQLENMGMGQQVAPESNLVSDQLERFPSNASFNGNNEPISSNLHEDEIWRELLEDTAIIPGDDETDFSAFLDL